MKYIHFVVFLLISNLIHSQANTNPVFGLVPREVPKQITTATTSKQTLANLTTIYTAGNNGGKIAEIGVEADTTTVASLFFIVITDTAGANGYLFDQISISAVTANSTTTAFRGINTYNNLQLKAGQQIKAGANIIPVGGHLTTWVSAADF